MHRFMSLVLVVLACTASAVAAEGRITVTGTGSVQAPPDMAVISLGVSTEGETAADAMQANSAAMTAVLDRLKEAGLEARDLQTSDLSLSPRWENPSNGDLRTPAIVGYLASNQLSVRVRDLSALGTILDVAVRDGANTLGGLSFGMLDSDAQEDEARRLAVADAMHRAEVLASAAGVTLGALIEMSESGGPGGPVPMARMEMAMADAVPVAAGEVGLTASVTMVFAIGE